MAHQYIVKRVFQSVLLTGIAATFICFAITLVYWPIWGSLAKVLIKSVAGKGLQEVDPKAAAKYISVFAEATFFWMVINAWIWQALIFGTYGKTSVTERQPVAGIWYTCVGMHLGILGFLVVVAFLGVWWKPFNLAVLFAPKTAEEVHLAIEGWEASNFYALTVIMIQIPFASVLQKWPFAGKVKPPWDGFGVMMFSTVASLLVWFAMIIPSLMNLSIGGQGVFTKPMGSWPTFVAFCQAFIWCSIIPAEGGEHYPMKLFARKQPYMGFAGFAISLVMAFVLPAILRPLVTPLNLLPGAPVDLVVASLLLSVVVATLLWHHVFDDFPTGEMVRNQTVRVLIRVATWLVLGLAFGVLWLKTFKKLPFGGNDLGMGFPNMRLLAGQFAFLMVFLYFNAFFDKWPLVKRVRIGVLQEAKSSIMP